MKIKLIEPRGFCFGVRRALDILDGIRERPVYVLHEVVHNQNIVNYYKQQGFIFVDDLSEVSDNSVLVFSAHGVSQQIENEAKQKNLKIIDTTCPFVKKVHRWVKSLEQQDRTIILIGKKAHAEIKGIQGQLNNPQGAYIISNIDEIGTLPDLKKVGIATQTTLSQTDTSKIIQKLQQKYTDCITQSGICQATTERQKALQEACKECDTILVVGDKNSSNCMRLIEIAQQNHRAVFLIEHANDVERIKIQGTVGITAAASAPERIVQEVLKLLQSNRY